MPRLPSHRFLSPRVADWLIYNVDRPLGFYITILIGILGAYGFARETPQAGVFAGWPSVALAVVGFAISIVGVCLLLVAVWCARTVLVWGLMVVLLVVVAPIDWAATRLQRYLRSPE